MLFLMHYREKVTEVSPWDLVIYGHKENNYKNGGKSYEEREVLHLPPVWQYC